MGNRGDLHAEDGTLGRRNWKIKRWITCTLDAGSRPGVAFDAPGQYYPLFFHDEAVALAAGHRPCGQCRRDAFKNFLSAWHAVYGFSNLAVIDQALHQSRLEHGVQRRYRAALSDLPDGVFVCSPTCPGEAMLVWQGELLPWSHGGYGTAIKSMPCQTVLVLTPTVIVGLLHAGYQAKIAA